MYASIARRVHDVNPFACVGCAILWSIPKEKNMPVVARFYGILIKMYFSQSEHGIPHFHAMYGEFNGVFSIEPLE
jgi:hypothetical protein